MIVGKLEVGDFTFDIITSKHLQEGIVYLVQIGERSTVIAYEGIREEDLRKRVEGILESEEMC